MKKPNNERIYNVTINMFTIDSFFFDERSELFLRNALLFSFQFLLLRFRHTIFFFFYAQQLIKLQLFFFSIIEIFLTIILGHGKPSEFFFFFHYELLTSFLL